MKLVYAAHSCCPCGAGLAYERSSDPFRGYWDCSAILLGTARSDVKHTAQLPFVFYEIKSELQPSAKGATTRPNTVSGDGQLRQAVRELGLCLAIAIGLYAALEAFDRRPRRKPRVVLWGGRSIDLQAGSLADLAAARRADRMTAALRRVASRLRDHQLALMAAGDTAREASVHMAAMLRALQARDRAMGRR